MTMTPFPGALSTRIARTAYVLVTPPKEQPISLDEAKAQARIDDDYGNALLQNQIVAAREYAEEYLGYGLLTQTWRLELDAFYEVMTLPMALKLQNDPNATPSTAILVQYYDTAGVLQTLAPTVYQVDATSRPARVVRAPLQIWPIVQSDRRTACVLITYVVGWTSADLVPQRIKQGIRSYLTYLDCDRDGLEPNAKEALMAAEACWTDRLFYVAPDVYAYPYAYAGW